MDDPEWRLELLIEIHLKPRALRKPDAGVALFERARSPSMNELQTEDMRTRIDTYSKYWFAQEPILASDILTGERAFSLNWKIIHPRSLCAHGYMELQTP